MIRKFIDKDLASVMSIWLSGNLQAHSFINESYWRENFDAVSQMILAADVFVYEENDEIYGFVGLENNYVAGIFVRQDRQCNGIGKRMLNFLKQKFSELYLNVYCKNEKALRFYRREGFEVVREEIERSTGEKEFVLKWCN